MNHPFVEAFTPANFTEVAICHEASEYYPYNLAILGDNVIKQPNIILTIPRIKSESHIIAVMSFNVRCNTLFSHFGKRRQGSIEIELIVFREVYPQNIWQGFAKIVYKTLLEIGSNSFRIFCRNKGFCDGRSCS